MLYNYVANTLRQVQRYSACCGRGGTIHLLPETTRKKCSGGGGGDGGGYRNGNRCNVQGWRWRDSESKSTNEEPDVTPIH